MNSSTYSCISHRSRGGGSPTTTAVRPHSGQGQGLRPLSQGLTGLGLFSDHDYFRDKNSSGYRTSGSGSGPRPGSGQGTETGVGLGQGVGAAPVGVIAICRPGVFEDEKTDQIRSRMFPTTHKKRFGQTGGSGYDPYNRGFMSLLRPIDDEVSLTATASDENNSDGGDDDSAKRQELDDADQEQGLVSPTSRYPPSATSPKKGGGGGSFTGMHMPEYTNGNGGGSDSSFNSNSRKVNNGTCM